MLSGHGNNGKDGREGVRRLNVLGTYLHGPLLPKNSWLADRLIQLALAAELGPSRGSSRSTTSSRRPRTSRRASPRAGADQAAIESEILSEMAVSHISQAFPDRVEVRGRDHR